MATYSITPSAQPQGIHKTLSGTTADSVSVAAAPFRYGVEIFNRHSLNAMYVRADGTTAVGEADGTVYVPAGQSVYWKQRKAATTFSIVGTDNPYSVHVIDQTD